jgi:Xaa-Pro dipeptidase
MLLHIQTAETTLIIPELDASRLQDIEIKQITHRDGEDAVAMVGNILPAGTKLGIEKGNIKLNTVETLLANSTLSLSDLKDISYLIIKERLIKDNAEIEIFKEACRITDQMLLEWRKKVQSGVQESDLRMELVKQMILTNDVSVDLEFICATGINTSSAHAFTTPRTVVEGDPIMVDFGAIFKNYYADETRTFFLGQPDNKMREIYEIVHQANLAGLAAVKPGRPIKEVDNAARAIIEKAGYGEFFTHRTGHGIGLDIHEAPSVDGSNNQLMEPGMIFTVEPGIYLPGHGGVRIEDDVLVTDDGYLVLTHYPKDLEKIII